MKTLLIDVTKQGKAVNFALGPLTKEELLQNFPEAKPLRMLHIPFEIEDNLEPYKDAVVQHVVPLLTGLSYEQIKQIGALFFIRPSTGHEFLKIIQQTQNELEKV